MLAIGSEIDLILAFTSQKTCDWDIAGWYITGVSGKVFSWASRRGAVFRFEFKDQHPILIGFECGPCHDNQAPVNTPPSTQTA